MWHHYARLHATLSWILYLWIYRCQMKGLIQHNTSALFIKKMTEQECRFKSTSCPVSGVIQTLISMCLISSLPLHRGRVIALLHIQCPELKLPKASALKRWINHLDFLHTTANHLGVRLTLPPLIIKIERSEAFFSCLAVPLALINGAPLMENYTGNVTLRKRVGAQPWLYFIAEGEKGFIAVFFFSFLLFFLRLVSRGISRNNQTWVRLHISMLPVCCANIAGILSRYFNLSEVPVEWPNASRE